MTFGKPVIAGLEGLRHPKAVDEAHGIGAKEHKIKRILD